MKPPAHWLLAAWMKYQPPPDEEAKPASFAAAVAAENGAYALPRRFFLNRQ